MIKDILKTARKWQSPFQLLLVASILILVNIIAGFYYFRIDLTEEKRYTLTSSTKALLKDIDDPILVDILLGGTFPAGFKRLQRATREMLDDFRAVNALIDYRFIDPNEGTKEEIEENRKILGNEGVFPTNLRIKDGSGTVEKLIYPYAILHLGQVKVAVNLLEAEVPGMSPEKILNNSISLMEYKFASGIERLVKKELLNVVFLKGHGELTPEQTADLRREIRPMYNYSFLHLDSVFRINPAVDLLIVAKPRGPFSEPDKFKIDQFVMKGGKVLWLLDPLHVGLDSMRSNPAYIPLEYDLNLDDLLFKWGARIQKNLVLDMECSGIPLQIGIVGGTPQYELFPWYYHPAVIPRTDHPVVNNLGRVHFEFPATVDTIRTKTDIKKTVLLASSDYTRLQYPPVQLNFEILRQDPDPSKFNKPSQPLILLLEGTFSSHYENRVPQHFLDSLNALGETYKAISEPTAMIIASDGDLIRNPYNAETNEARPLGYNVYDRQMYNNKELFINIIEYLLNKRGLIEARSREVKLRQMDMVRVNREKTIWKMINLGGPLILLLLTGVSYYLWRKKRYGQPQTKSS